MPLSDVVMRNLDVLISSILGDETEVDNEVRWRSMTYAGFSRDFLAGWNAAWAEDASKILSDLWDKKLIRQPADLRDAAAYVKLQCWKRRAEFPLNTESE